VETTIVVCKPQGTMKITAATLLLLCPTNGFVIPNNMQTRANQLISTTNLYAEGSQSLADMEDDVERKLDQAEPLESLQHTMRAPSKNQQSSQTFSTQEQTFKDEDDEAYERQRTIKRLLDEDDVKWKEERRRKIMGKYADAKSEEEVQSIKDEEDKKIEEGKSDPLCFLFLGYFDCQSWAFSMCQGSELIYFFSLALNR